MGDDFDPWGPGKRGMLLGAAVTLLVVATFMLIF